jgi:hypothetical protein
MDENEQFVREHWDEVKLCGPSGDGCHLELGPQRFHIYGNMVCNAWINAAQFTRERQRRGEM